MGNSSFFYDTPSGRQHQHAANMGGHLCTRGQLPMGADVCKSMADVLQWSVHCFHSLLVYMRQTASFVCREKNKYRRFCQFHNRWVSPCISNGIGTAHDHQMYWQQPKHWMVATIESSPMHILPTTHQWWWRHTKLRWLGTTSSYRCSGPLATAYGGLWTCKWLGR